MGTNAWCVVPNLLGFLDRKDYECSFTAAGVLASINAPSHPRWPEFATQLRGNHKAAFILRYMIFGNNNYGQPYDSADRRFAIIALGAIGPAAAGAYPEIMEVFKYGQNQETRGVALNAAAKIDTAQTLPLLKDTLKNGAEWAQVSAAAALTLAEVAPEDPQTHDLLRAALQDTRSLARLGAARALWRLKAPASEVLPVMTALLNHKLVSIRKAALEGIAEIGSAARPGKADVERLTKDENGAVRGLAESVLRKF
jgi:HEAT repeat protein